MTSDSFRDPHLAVAWHRVLLRGDRPVRNGQEADITVFRFVKKSSDMKGVLSPLCLKLIWPISLPPGSPDENGVVRLPNLDPGPKFVPAQALPPKPTTANVVIAGRAMSRVLASPCFGPKLSG